MFVLSKGSRSSQHEQGSAALHAMELDDNLGGEAIQVIQHVGLHTGLQYHIILGIQAY